MLKHGQLPGGIGKFLGCICREKNITLRTLTVITSKSVLSLDIAQSTRVQFVHAVVWSCVRAALWQLRCQIGARRRIKFCVKRGRPASSGIFGYYCTRRARASVCDGRVKAGQVSVQDDDHSGRPATTKHHKMWKHICKHIYRGSHLAISPAALSHNWNHYGVC